MPLNSFNLCEPSISEFIDQKFSFEKPKEKNNDLFWLGFTDDWEFDEYAAMDCHYGNCLWLISSVSVRYINLDPNTPSCSMGGGIRRLFTTQEKYQIGGRQRKNISLMPTQNKMRSEHGESESDHYGYSTTGISFSTI